MLNRPFLILVAWLMFPSHFPAQEPDRTDTEGGPLPREVTMPSTAGASQPRPRQAGIDWNDQAAHLVAASSRAAVERILPPMPAGPGDAINPVLETRRGHVLHLYYFLDASHTASVNYLVSADGTSAFKDAVIEDYPKAK